MRLGEIGPNPTTPPGKRPGPAGGAESAAAMWEDLNLSRKRAMIKTLMAITLLSSGKGARRAFDLAQFS